MAYEPRGLAVISGSTDARFKLLDDGTAELKTNTIGGLPTASGSIMMAGAPVTVGGVASYPMYSFDLSSGNAAEHIGVTSSNGTLNAALTAGNKNLAYALTWVYEQASSNANLTIDSDAGADEAINLGTETYRLAGGTGVTTTNTTNTTTITLDAEITKLAGMLAADELAVITPTEMAILDGATATTAELNLIDGDTARGTDAVASGDGLLVNDGGTMKMTNVDTVSTYFAAHSVGGTNMVTVGALNAGSITSGFGNINNGASTITTTGLISGGSLDIDDVLINGATIGHTDDTDLLTLADGVLTVAGEVSMTTLDIGGTNVTATGAELNYLDNDALTAADITKLAALDATAAELNIMDGGTAAAGTTIADGDRVVLNDNGTMVQATVQELAAYLDDEITAMPNLTTTAATTVGTIGTGVWNGTAVASAYLDADTAHLSTTQTFTGAKTFSADAAFTGDTNTFSSANADDPLILIQNTTNDASGPRLRLSNDRGAAGQDNDVAGIIEFYSDDDNQDQVLFAQIKATVADASNGAEGGKLELGVASHDGEMNAGITLTDGSAEDEIDVTIGKGTSSVVTIAGDLTVTGTTTTVNQTVVNNTTDVLVFEGASADAHETTLKVTEPTADASFSLPALSAGNYHIPAIAGTATQASAAVTAAEFALLDGASTVATVTVADGDGVMFNDAGTMKQVTVQSLAAYFDDEITAMPNLVTTAATTVGALDAGSITSNFGNINNGASTITTTGLISGGSLDIDDVLINGATIGHTDDTDLLTLADGVLTVAGEVSMTTLDIGGTNVTATAAELNLIDGGTARGTDAVASGDGLLVNDGGTMKMTNVDTVSTYFAAHSVGGTNMVTVGALNAGSITSGFGNIDNGTSTINTAGVLSVDVDSGETINASGGGVGAAGSITLGAGADAGLYVKSDDLYIENKTSDKDIIFRGNDGGTFTTIATVDASEGTFKVETAGKLDYAGTLVTATGAELNYLDNDALTAADLTKLAALDVTAAELNLIDGGTARGTDAVATGDGLLVNDNGTMKMTNVDTVSTYFAAHSVGGTNMVTVGALNAGSITSGFGNIDNGTSTINTAGVLSIDVDTGVTPASNATGIGAAGSLTIGAGADAGLYVASDDLYVENKTTDKDIIFRVSDNGTYTTVAHVDGADGRFQFAAGKLDIGGTAVTATAAELNLLDDATVTTAELNKLAGGTSNSAANKVLILDAQGDFEMQDSDKIWFGNDADANIHWDGDSLEIGTHATSAINIGNGTSEVTIGDNLTVAGNLTVTGTTVTNTVEVISTSSGVLFEGGTDDGHEGTMISAVAGADVTYTLPNMTGHVPLLAVSPGTTTITSTPAELNLLDTSAAGTIQNSKAVIYGGSGEVNATTLQIGGSSITATAAEINLLDAAAGSSVALATGDGMLMWDATDSNAAKKVLMSDVNTFIQATAGTFTNAAGIDFSTGITGSATQDADANYGSIRSDGGVSVAKGIYVVGAANSTIASLGVPAEYDGGHTGAGGFIDYRQVVRLGGSMQLARLNGEVAADQSVLCDLSDATKLAAGTFDGYMIYVTTRMNQNGTASAGALGNTTLNKASAQNNFDVGNKFYFCEEGVWHSSPFATAAEE